jgi:hypothetical protein
MKRKRLLLLAATLFLVLLATSGAYALIRETDIQYYGEDAFLDFTGETYIDCDGNVSEWGNTHDSWRVFDQYNCNTGIRVVHKCQQTDGMGGWITLGCPANQP